MSIGFFYRVENGVPVAGPQPLPFEFGNMTGFDKCETPGLYGWFEFVVAEKPAFNAETQKLVETLTTNVATKKVSGSWAVTALTADDIAALHPVPLSVSTAQAKVALFNAGFLEAAETEIATSYTPIQIYWHNSPTFERNHPYIMGIGLLLGLTEDQIDGLFFAARAVAF